MLLAAIYARGSKIGAIGSLPPRLASNGSRSRPSLGCNHKIGSVARILALDKSAQRPSQGLCRRNKTRTSISSFQVYSARNHVSNQRFIHTQPSNIDPLSPQRTPGAPSAEAPEMNDPAKSFDSSFAMHMNRPSAAAKPRFHGQAASAGANIPEGPLQATIKNWLNLSTLLVPKKHPALKERTMGTVEKAFNHLYYHRLPTNTLRVYRMRLHVVESAMRAALDALQRLKPELQGTLPLYLGGPPTSYVDTYRPAERAAKARQEAENAAKQEEVPQRSAEQAEDDEEFALTDEGREAINDRMRALGMDVSRTEGQGWSKEAPDWRKNINLKDTFQKKGPKFGGMDDPPRAQDVSISLEVIAKAHPDTYLKEVTNMLNSPFREGSPLFRVRLIRHDGGTDVVIAGHRGLYDELSFESTCMMLLGLYDVASEGRLQGTPDTEASAPLLRYLDDAYPAFFRNYVWTQNRSSLRRFLDRFAFDANPLPLPRSTSLSASQGKASAFDLSKLATTSSTSVPPSPSIDIPLSPSLNASATIFGTLPRSVAESIADKCQAEGIEFDCLLSAAVLKASAQLIRENALSEMNNGSVPADAPTSPKERQNSKKKSRSKQSKRLTSDTSLPKTWSELFSRIWQDITRKEPQDKLTTMEETIYRTSKFAKLGRDDFVPKEGDDHAVPMVVSFVSDLRHTFDPPIAPVVSGQLSSHTLLPIVYNLKRSIWYHAHMHQQMRKDSTLSHHAYTDMVPLPLLAEWAASDEHWEHAALPQIIFVDSSASALGPDFVKRFQIYDEKAALSCWNPGIIVCSHISELGVHLSLSYRKPLISDHHAHKILTNALKSLSL